jgi:hypothetical protein
MCSSVVRQNFCQVGLLAIHGSSYELLTSSCLCPAETTSAAGTMRSGTGAGHGMTGSRHQHSSSSRSSSGKRGSSCSSSESNRLQRVSWCSVCGVACARMALQCLHFWNVSYTRNDPGCLLHVSASSGQLLGLLDNSCGEFCRWCGDGKVPFSGRWIQQGNQGACIP